MGWQQNNTVPPVNNKVPELKKEFVVRLAAKPVDVLQHGKIKYQTGPEWLGMLHW